MTYLDANATEPLYPAARDATLAAMALTGNPSSVHAAGRAARRLLEDSRDTIAARFGAQPGDLVFTSGGTEANALAIHAFSPGRQFIMGATEHDAVRQAMPTAMTLPVDRHGVAVLDTLPAMLATGPALLCLMLANNETGTIQPIAHAAALCHAAGALLHVDAVQAGGRMAVDIAALGADSIAVSSHKMGGPAGAGALLVRPGLPIAALIAGGGQERGRRGGTHPLPAIAGFAAAAAIIADYQSPAALRDLIDTAASKMGARILGGTDRLPNTTCLALPGVRADRQVITLDMAGIQVSAGAACSSGKVARSHVLAAMGLGSLAGEAIRVSLPWNATEADARAFIAAYADMTARLIPDAA